MVRHYISVLSRQQRPVRFLWSRVLWRTGLCRYVTIDRGSYRLHFFPTALSALMFVGDGLRADEDFLHATLSPGDTYVDVGANVGALTVVAASIVGKMGRVVAIEPHPRIASYIVRNADLNGLDNVQVHVSAVGAAEGLIAFSDAATSDDQNSVSAHGGGITVPLRRLDDILADVREIDVLKIDVEGYELPVMQGATDVLARTRLVYFEAWEAHFAKYGYAFADVRSQLEAAGFVLRHPGSSQELSADWQPHKCVNLVARRA